MLEFVGNESAQDEVDGRSLLDEIAREGARRMLVAALETEVAGAPGGASRRTRRCGPRPGGSQWKGAHPKGDGRFRDDPGERAPRERPADRSGR